MPSLRTRACRRGSSSRRRRRRPIRPFRDANGSNASITRAGLDRVGARADAEIGVGTRHPTLRRTRTTSARRSVVPCAPGGTSPRLEAHCRTLTQPVNDRRHFHEVGSRSGDEQQTERPCSCVARFQNRRCRRIADPRPWRCARRSPRAQRGRPTTAADFDPAWPGPAVARTSAADSSMQRRPCDASQRSTAPVGPRKVLYTGTPSAAASRFMVPPPLITRSDSQTSCSPSTA